MKALAEELGKLLLEKGLTLSTAESCTGGGIASVITSISGSSEYFKGGIVAYANEVKTALLGVSETTLEKHGAVSEETVQEMAKGAMKSMKTSCAIATSGIAGPGGGTPTKPVGTIWIAVACNDKIVTKKLQGDNGREKNTKNSIEKALSLLIEHLK
ncbi:MAG: CinA family protein [Bacteroides sp.]|nr:CinA family protein [Bacteroides sp.]